MKKFLPVVISAAALSMSPLAAANSATVSYASMNVNGVSFTGVDLSGSLALHDNISLEVESRSVSNIISSVDVSYEETSVSLGYTTNISETVDAKFTLGSRNQGLTAIWAGYSASLDSTSTIYGVGMQAEVNDKVNLNFALLNSTGAGASMVTQLGADFEVADNMMIAIKASNEDLVESISLGMRFKF
ncbi:MAG: hypothetical protein QGG88_02000 [Gammaproteobacteria bacterium]|jgi:hypothetical protein|nr:hypothetical protein [Gammaproteobacteria bacterium]